MEPYKAQFSGFFVPGVLLSDWSKLFPQLMRSFYLIVPEADSQNKTNHTATESMKTALENGAFLCSILFEVNWTF